MTSTSRLLCLLAVLSSPTFLFSQPTGSASTAAATPDFVLEEQSLVVAAASAAVADDESSFIAQIVRGPDARFGVSNSLAIMRRAVIICAQLKDAGGLVHARRAAALVIARNAQGVEKDQLEHIERLYWEAWLRSEILDDQTGALAVIDSAGTLAPTDPRLVALRARAQALRKISSH